MRGLMFIVAGVVPALALAFGFSDHSAILGLLGACLLFLSPVILEIPGEQSTTPQDQTPSREPVARPLRRAA